MANSFSAWSILGGLSTLGLMGCGPNTWGTSPDFDSSFGSNEEPLFAGKTQRATGKVAPIAGGTLLVTKDNFAVASDPDRDLVHVVDLSKQKVTSIQLKENDEPGRVVEGPAGKAYVLGRRGGVLIEVDIAAGTAKRAPVCAAPRGVAYSAADSKVFVACRSGLLAAVDASSLEMAQKYQFDADLRDVLISGDDLVLTRFKSAEVMVVSRSGSLLRRTALDQAKPSGFGSTSSGTTPSVAFRAMSLPRGQLVVGHIESSNNTLPSGAGAYYGASCGGSVADPSLTLVDAYGGTDGKSFTIQPARALGGATGPIDLAVSGDSARVAVLATGNSWAPPNTPPPKNMWVTSVSDLQAGSFNTSCGGSVAGSGTSDRVEGEPVAVAFDAGGQWVVQSREPAQLQLERGGTISLATDSRFDTGLAMFHMNTGGGIACTSCHPEAGEDGHTWNFSVGPRRSQDLEGGINSRAPYHWTGDLGDFDSLFQEVMIKRMSLTASVSADQRGALRDWIDSVPSVATADDLETSAIERGRVLFNDAQLACGSCHGGKEFSDNALHDVGTGGKFITPSLLGVNLRAPLFHDGCAVSLAGRFGPCGGGDAHGVTSKLTKDQEGDLLSYMRSL